MSKSHSVLTTVLLLAVAPLAMAQAITPEHVFALGFEPDQKAAFERGEIISSDQSKLKSSFVWLKQDVQDRPTFVLAHRLLFEEEGLVLRAERHFYVGQSYNSLQILIALFPAGDKTTMFYLNRTSTDQVAGFMSGTRHSMGRMFMEKAIRKQFDAALAAVGK